MFPPLHCTTACAIAILAMSASRFQRLDQTLEASGTHWLEASDAEIE
jgi:hypothetical protein